MKKLTLAVKKYIFLRNVAQVNIKLISYAFSERQEEQRKKREIVTFSSKDPRIFLL